MPIRRIPPGTFARRDEVTAETAAPEALPHALPVEQRSDLRRARVSAAIATYPTSRSGGEAMDTLPGGHAGADVHLARI